MAETGKTQFVVTILGSGTCVPSLTRSSCSILMEIGHQKLLFDSGPGTMRRLLEAGITIYDITHLFYTHLHPDHTGELVPFLFATKYSHAGQRKIPLMLIAGNGFLHFFQKLKSVYGQWIHFENEFLNILEMDNTNSDLIRFPDFSVHSIPMSHNPESIAFKITTADHQTVVFSGDTDYTSNLIDIAANVDLLICESATPDDIKIPGHLTPSLAGKIASESRAKKLILTHFYPECEQVDIAKECRKTYSGDLLLAEDLMKIEIHTII
ncbi:MAG: MBL fold metallo-hydrolase [Pseudomonadota bacterium]